MGSEMCIRDRPKPVAPDFNSLENALMANATCVVDGHFDKMNRMRLMSLFVCVCYDAQMRSAIDISCRRQYSIWHQHTRAPKKLKRGVM